jgi:hypothetical protein
MGGIGSTGSGRLALVKRTMGGYLPVEMCGTSDQTDIFSEFLESGDEQRHGKEMVKSCSARIGVRQT